VRRCDATPAGTGLLVSGEQFKLQHNSVSFIVADVSDMVYICC